MRNRRIRLLNWMVDKLANTKHNQDNLYYTNCREILHLNIYDDDLFEKLQEASLSLGGNEYTTDPEDLTEASVELHRRLKDG